MTNWTVACCLTTHATEYAGGLVTLPSTINFNDVWTHASFLDNPTIYCTVIALGCLYILGAIFCLFMDRRDKARISFTLVGDTSNEHDYFYEIILFTGTRKDAQCNSRVSCVVSGDQSETQVKKLIDRREKLFRRGAVNSFLISNPT
jgi:hypothetical protein